MIKKDNLINQKYCEHLAHTLSTEGKFPWYFVYDSANTGSGVFEPSFVHTLWYQGQPHSDKWQIFYPAVLEIFDKFNIEPAEIMRVRLGLITKSYKNIVHGPHVDWENVPHKTILFYFNNADGDTQFYKEHWASQNKPAVFNLEESVTPKQNSAVLFDGYQYHSSSTPVVSPWRLTMNINFY
jgi:hypothetical protein